MCIQDLSVHPLMKCTADMSDAFAISLPDERWKSRCFYCLATYKKDNFSWFSVFFIISKWFKLLFLLLLPSSSSCPAWRKPVAHWGNWPEDFSCPRQILHAPGNRTPVSFEPCRSQTQSLNPGFTLLTIRPLGLSQYSESTINTIHIWVYQELQTFQL